MKPFVAVPNGHNIELHMPKKRSFNKISQNKWTDGNSGTNSNVNQQEQTEVVRNIHQIEANLPHH